MQVNQAGNPVEAARTIGIAFETGKSDANGIDGINGPAGRRQARQKPEIAPPVHPKCHRNRSGDRQEAKQIDERAEQKVERQRAPGFHKGQRDPTDHKRGTEVGDVLHEPVDARQAL